MQWNRNTRETAEKQQCTAWALCIEWRGPRVLYPITPCYCHTTQVVVAAPATMMKHPSPPEKKMFAYYFIIPRGHRKISPSVVTVTG